MLRPVEAARYHRPMRSTTRPVRSLNSNRRLALAAAATFGLALLGGSAIFALHRTMQVPMQIAPRVEAAGTPVATVSASPASPTMPVSPVSATDTAREGTPWQGITGASSDSPVGPLPRQESTPVSLRVPLPADPPERGDRAGAGRKADAARARRNEAGRNTGEDRAVRAGKPDDRPGLSPWGGELDGRANGSARPRGSASGGADANMAAAPPAGTPAAAQRSAQRLEQAQQEQCADTQFIGRLICGERVRLRFCRDRWNAHPDCTSTAPTLNH